MLLSRRHFSCVCLPSCDFPFFTMPKIDVFFLFWETGSRRMRATKKEKLWIFSPFFIAVICFHLFSDNPKFGQNVKPNLFIIFLELNSLPFLKRKILSYNCANYILAKSAFPCTYTHTHTIFPPSSFFLLAFFFSCFRSSDFDPLKQRRMRRRRGRNLWGKGMTGEGAI